MMFHAKKTILVTGASGVVGTALLPELDRHQVIALTHRQLPRGRTQAVHGDLTQPILGIDRVVYRGLAEQVDAIIHCAAVTDFAAGAQASSELNVRGTEHLLEFAADANATFHYVSTAFVARDDKTRTQIGEAAANPTDYLVSKRRAEQLVRGASVPTTIVRPSVVIGDSRTGEAAKFQGLHSLTNAVLKNALPLLPLDPDARIDFVPQDVVARAIAGLVNDDVDAGEYWVTAGDAAMTVRRMIDTAVTAGQQLGIDVVPPRLVQPAMIDRLVRPVFISPLPPDLRRKFDDMLTMTALFAGAEPFPTSLPDMPGVSSLTETELDMAFAASVEYLAHTKKISSQPVEAVA